MLKDSISRADKAWMLRRINLEITEGTTDSGEFGLKVSLCE
jgi:hypothetical protein